MTPEQGLSSTAGSRNLVARKYECGVKGYFGNDLAEASVEDNSHTHHEIDYIEIEVADMAEAKRFYGAAFDWEFNDYGPGYAGIRKR